MQPAFQGSLPTKYNHRRFSRTIPKNIALRRNLRRLRNRSVGLPLKSLQYPKTRKCNALLSNFGSAVVLPGGHTSRSIHPTANRQLGMGGAAAFPAEYMDMIWA